MMSLNNIVILTCNGNVVQSSSLQCSVQGRHIDTREKPADNLGGPRLIQCSYVH